jgi:hypothetical protein
MTGCLLGFERCCTLSTVCAAYLQLCLFCSLVRDLFFLRWRPIVCKAMFRRAAGRTGRTGALSEARRNRRQRKTGNLVSVRCARSFRMRFRALPDPNRSFHLLPPTWVRPLFRFSPCSATECQPFWQSFLRATPNVVLLSFFSDLF